MKAIKVQGKYIGDGHPTFVIAEIGINHNGDFKTALAMIDFAVEAGVNAVKFQAFKAKYMYSKKAGYLNYASSKKTIYDIVKEMETPVDWPEKLSVYCKKKNVIFFSSVCDELSVELMDPYMPIYKITSYEMTHIPLLKYIARKNKPIIMSTGTATMDEIRESVEAIYSTGNKQLILMQCTGSYPAPLNSINVKSIFTLKNEFDVPVGLSDHSEDPIVAPMSAVAFGANLVEKHITLSKRLPGPDHIFALEPDELKTMVLRIREVEKVLGTGEKVVQDTERYVRGFCRRSIYAIKNIQKGELISRKNISVLRTGDMKFVLNPKDYELIIGKKSLRSIKKDSPISWDLVS